MDTPPHHHARSLFCSPSHAWTRRFDATPKCAGRPSNLTLRALPLRQMPFILRRIVPTSAQRGAAGWDREDILFAASARAARGRTRACRWAVSAPGPLAAAGGATSAAGSAGRASPTTAWSGPTSSPSSCSGLASPAGPRYSTRARPAEEPCGWQWDMDARRHLPRPLPARLDRLRATAAGHPPHLPPAFARSPPQLPREQLSVGHFLWQIENSGRTRPVVSLMFTWQNGMGTANDVAGGHSNRAFVCTLRGGNRQCRVQSGSGEMPVSAAAERSVPASSYVTCSARGGLSRRPAAGRAGDLRAAPGLCCGCAGRRRRRRQPQSLRHHGDGGALWRDFAPMAGWTALTTSGRPPRAKPLARLWPRP